MNIQTFKFNPLEVNTYVLWDETKECAVIDPAPFYEEEREALHNFLLDNGLTVKHLLLTHLHFDHIYGVEWLVALSGGVARCHKDDLFLLDRAGFPLLIGDCLHDGDKVQFGQQSLKAFHTPGHSPGGLVFYAAAQGCLFSGDVLFREGVGRTDLPGGNHAKLQHSIKTRLFALPDSTAVYPGHGPETSIGFEKQNNPFITIQ
jgi:glyoxylase-like metal-dependent hydrolase (beta-lactamase superfamily II)